MKNKAQSSVEFIILVGAVMFFFIGFLIYIESNLAVKEREFINNELMGLASDVKKEIELAHVASEGYSRKFSIPEKINGNDYEIQIIENSVYVRTFDGKYALSLPVNAVTGNAVKGENLIRKENGRVYLN